MKSSFILSMCLLYMIQFLTQLEILYTLLGVITVAVFLLSLSGTKKVPRYFSIFMFAIGTIVMIKTGKGMAGMADGLLTNVPLLTLIILVPLIAVPLKLGGYFTSIHYYLQHYAAEPKKIFTSISLFIFTLGPVLNLGSIRVLHEILKDIKLNAKLAAKAYLTGFSSIILWSPYFGSVALVLYYLDVSVTDHILTALPLSFLILGMGNVLFRLQWKKESEVEKQQQAEASDVKEEKEHKRKLRKLGLLIALLMATVLILERVTHWPMMFLVSAISILFPIVWAIFKRQSKQWWQQIKDFKQKSVPKMGNEIILFISAGLFGKSLTGTVAAEYISVAVQQVSSVSFLLFILMILLFMISFTFIGIHPVVIAIPLLTQIDPVAVGSTPPLISLLFMLGWSISAVLSPVNPLNLLVSNSLKRSGISVGLKWNGIHLLILLITGITYIYLMNKIL